RFDPPSDLSTPQGARGGRTGDDRAPGTFQVPLLQSGNALRRRRSMAYRPTSRGLTMRINLTSVYVDDQRAALAFYTDVLGFAKHHDIPLGDDSWLTVVSPESPDGPQLLLE